MSNITRTTGMKQSILLAIFALFILHSASDLELLAQQRPSSASGQFRKAIQHFESGQYVKALEVLTELKKRYPNDFDIQHLIAITLDILGRPAAASRHFQMAVQLNPGSVQAHVNYGANLIRSGKVTEAVQQFQEALEIDPRNATANFNLGTLLLHQKKLQEALPWLQRAYTNQPRLYENGYQLALCHFVLGDYQEVHRILASMGSVPEERGEFYLLLALNQRALGKAVAARKSMSRILPSLAEHPDAHEQVALLLFSQGMYQEALPVLKEATRLFPQSYLALQNFARAEYETGELSGARQHSEQAMSLKETAEIHVLLGEILEAERKSIEAVDHFQQAVRLDPSEDNLYILGYEFLSHWNWEAALQVFESALQEFPESWRITIGKGAAYLGQNEYERATQVFLQATEVAPKLQLAYQLLAQSFEQASDSFNPAVSRFEEFYRENPENPWASYYHVLADFRASTRGSSPLDSTVAVDRLNTAISGKPDFFEALLLLGEIHFREKNWGRASSVFERAAHLNPDHVQVHYMFALALQRSGKADRAKLEIKRYKELKEKQTSEAAERTAQTTKFIVDLRKH